MRDLTSEAKTKVAANVFGKLANGNALVLDTVENEISVWFVTFQR